MSFSYDTGKVLFSKFVYHVSDNPQCLPMKQDEYMSEKMELSKVLWKVSLKDPVSNTKFDS